MTTSILSTPVTISQVLICLAAAIAAGILNALIFNFRNHSSSSFAVTLALCPAVMCMIVMVVSGNLGAAVAMAGGFALVRFRSIPGTGREICAIFTDMTIGVILGMGYIFVAVIFFIITAAFVLILTFLRFGETKNEKLIKVTIPEDYDYTGLFDEVFEKFGASASIEKIKTTNMGSLIDVTYRVVMDNPVVPKEMLDDMRARNANLSIMITSADAAKNAL